MGTGSSSAFKGSRTTVAVATAASFFMKGARASVSASPTTSSFASTHAMPNLSQFFENINDAKQREDDAFLRRVFDLHANSHGKLTPTALLAALKEVKAPVLADASVDDSAADQIFRRADVNLSGDVDFFECEPLQSF
jgi:hypothetical protein